MKRLLILFPVILLLVGCAGQKQGKLQGVEKQEGPAGDHGFAKEIEWPNKKRSIESISANTGAAMSSYPIASSVVAGDKALISKSTASNATQQAAMSTIKDYVLSDVIDFSATPPLSFNSTTGVLSLTPWASQSAFETWLGWSFSGSGGGGITVSSTLPTTAGSAALNDSTHILTVASDTGYTQFTGSFTAWDTTPAAFGFGAITDAVAGQEYCWTTPVTVAGINRPTTVASTADSYKINGTTSTATSIALGDTLAPCMVASSTAGATVSGNMTVGGVDGDPIFSVTTALGCDDGLLTNGCFTDGTTGWVAAGDASIAAVGGQLVYTQGSTGYMDARQVVEALDGKSYTVTFDIISIAQNEVIVVYLGLDLCGSYTTTGTSKTCTVPSFGGISYNLKIRSSLNIVGTQFTVDNVKVVQN